MSTNTKSHEVLNSELETIKNSTEGKKIDYKLAQAQVERLQLKEEVENQENKTEFPEDDYSDGETAKSEDKIEAVKQEALTLGNKAKETGKNVFANEFVKGILEFLTKIPLFGKFFQEILDSMENEQVEEVIENVETLSKKFENDFDLIKVLTPEEKKLFNEVIENPETFTNEERKKILTGEISMKEAYALAVEKNNKLPDIKNVLEKRVDNFINNVKEEFKANIEQQYNITINEENRQKFEEIFADTIHDEEMRGDLLKYYTEERIGLGETVNFILESIAKPAEFMLRLVFAGVIPASALTFDFVEGGFDLIKVTIGGLEINQYINTSDLAKYIEGETMTPEEATLMYAILYKKGGLVFRLLGKTVSLMGNTVVENFGVKIEGASSNLSGYLKEADEFARIERSLLGKIPDVDTKPIVTEASDLFKIIEKNYELLDLKKATPAELPKKLEAFNLKYETKLSSLDDVTKLGVQMKDLSGKLINSISPSKILSEVSLREFRRETQKVLKMQNNLFEGGLASVKGATLDRLRALGAKGNLTRLGDRIAFNASNPEDLKSLSQLAKESPEIIGHVLGKAPIILLGYEVFEGIKNGDLEESSEYAQLLLTVFPIIGSGLLIRENGITRKDGNLKIENGAALAVGSTLLSVEFGMAGYAFTKGAGSLGRFMIHPLVDIKDITYWSGVTAKRTAQASTSLAKVFASKGIKEGSKEALRYLTKIPGLKNVLKSKVGRIATILTIGAATTSAYAYETFFEDEDIKFLKESGILRENNTLNPEKAKEFIKNNGLEEEQLNELISVIIENKTEENEDISFVKNGDNLTIVSKNENVISDTFIDGELLTNLSYIGVENVDFIYEQKEA